MLKHSKTPMAPPRPLPAEPTGNGERRSSPRYLFTATSHIREIHSKTSLIARCADVCAGGCYIDTICPLPLGTTVVIRITHGGREFEATAVVANTHFHLGMGLAFTEIGQEHRTVLRSWLGELSGEIGEPCREVAPPAPPPAPLLDPAAATSGESAGAETNLRFVAHELITLLVRKKLLSEKQGTGLLREIFR